MKLPRCAKAIPDVIPNKIRRDWEVILGTLSLEFRLTKLSEVKTESKVRARAKDRKMSCKNRLPLAFPPLRNHTMLLALGLLVKN